MPTLLFLFLLISKSFQLQLSVTLKNVKIQLEPESCDARVKSLTIIHSVPENGQLRKQIRKIYSAR